MRKSTTIGLSPPGQHLLLSSCATYTARATTPTIRTVPARAHLGTASAPWPDCSRLRCTERRQRAMVAPASVAWPVVRSACTRTAEPSCAARPRAPASWWTEGDTIKLNLPDG